MDTIFIIILSAFSVYGLYCLAERLLFSAKIDGEKYLIFQCSEPLPNPEYTLRLLMKKYTDCEIIIKCDTQNREQAEIIDRLCLDYPFVHNSTYLKNFIGRDLS